MAERIHWNIDVHDSVDSTQDILKQKAEDSTPEGAVIHGLEQIKGRGRHGNTWISPKGNLYLSILLKPECELVRAGQLAFMMALAVGDTVSHFLSVEDQKKVSLKWPNDILYNGLKISGILLETNINKDCIKDLFIGVGVNIDTPPEGHIGLKEISEKTVSIETCRAVLLEKLADWYGTWQQKGFAPIRAAWLKQAHGLGLTVTARMPHASESGIFDGIDESGNLILRMEGGTKLIQAADIHFGV